MARTPSGTLFSVATVLSASLNTTVVTNAAEAVVTANAHGYANGDIVIIQSGWGRLQKRAFRVKSVATNTFTLEGADTSNVTLFPPGSGLGSVVKVNTWVQITTVMKPSTSGGDAKKINFKYTESDVEFSLNDGFSAVDRTYELDADSIGTPGYNALKTLTDVQTDTVFRSLAKNGALSFLPCTVALNDEEIMQDGSIVTVRLSISGNNRSTRYAS